jgi:predicted dehydrogenase
MIGDVTIAIVGMGYWGPNLLRCALEVEDTEVKAICDLDSASLARLARRYPNVGATRDLDRILGDDEIDAVVLATPVSTHYELGKRCMEAGKHVLIEKPLAPSVTEAEQLIELARSQDVILMPGHTFLYSPPVCKVKSLLQDDALGSLFFGTSSRVNLGIHQRDVSVLWDLAPHDFSILLYWLGRPTFVRAIGRTSIMPTTLDVVFVDVQFADGVLFHVELSWLAPTKLRRTVLVGSEKMVVYEDTSNEQVRIFDRGVDLMEPQTFGEFQLAYRSGDVLTPRLDVDEPLRMEVEDFVRAIRTGEPPRSSAQLGLEVVRMMEATQASLDFNGVTVPVYPTQEDRRRTPDRRRGPRGLTRDWQAAPDKDELAAGDRASAGRSDPSEVVPARP